MRIELLFREKKIVVCPTCFKFSLMRIGNSKCNLFFSELLDEMVLPEAAPAPYSAPPIDPIAIARAAAAASAAASAPPDDATKPDKSKEAGKMADALSPKGTHRSPQTPSPIVRTTSRDSGGSTRTQASKEKTSKKRARSEDGDSEKKAKKAKKKKEASDSESESDSDSTYEEENPKKTKSGKRKRQELNLEGHSAITNKPPAIKFFSTRWGRRSG